MLVYGSRWYAYKAGQEVSTYHTWKVVVIGGSHWKKVNVYSHIQKGDEERPGEQDDHPYLSPQKNYRTSPHGSPF